MAKRPSNVNSSRGPRIRLGLARAAVFGSLARLSRIQARRARGHGRAASVLLGGWAYVRHRGRDATLALLGFVALGLVWLPGPDPGFGPFASQGDAREFLRTLWQVEAGALALSLTIIVLAVQAYSSSTAERYGATLYRFIRASYLQQTYELGVVALLLNGVVLLGVGHGGAQGWAGLIVAVVSLVSIATLPLLLTRGLRSTERDVLLAQRRRSLSAAVGQEVDHEVQIRLGRIALQQVARDKAMEIGYLGTSADGTSALDVISGQAGSVSDINLLRLVRLNRRMRERGTLRLGAWLGEYVGPRTRLVALPEGARPRDVRLARRIVTVQPGRRRDQTLRRFLDDLHEEAIEAIRAGQPASFDSVADAYVETLMGFPSAWQSYGQLYSDALAQGLEFFPVTPSDEIRQQLYSNLNEALRTDSREIVFSAAYVPVRVAERALEFRAEGLIARMVRLYPAFLVAAWAHGGRTGGLLEERSYRHLMEFTRFYLVPRLERGSVADRVGTGAYVRLVFTQIETMLKLGIDAGKPGFVRTLDGHWSTLVRLDRVETLDPHPDEIPYLKQALEDGDPSAADLLQQATEEIPLVALFAELSQQRTIARFGLAMWAWRMGPPEWEVAFAELSAHLGSLAELAVTTTQALDAEDADRTPWSDWILGELQEGEAHFIGASEAILEAFVAMAIRRVTMSGSLPTLIPASWMSHRGDHLRGLLEEAARDRRNADLPDVVERAKRVGDALADAARAWESVERTSVIAAPLVPEKVAEFQRQALDALRENRVVPGLLTVAGAVRDAPGAPDTPPLITTTTHKALFVHGGRMVGADLVASDIGRVVAHLELDKLIGPMSALPLERALRDGPDPRASDAVDVFIERLRNVLSSTAQTRLGAWTALLLPVQWRLSQALGLAFLRAGAAPPDAWNATEGVVRAFTGTFDGRPAFQFAEVPDDRLYIVDLARYALAVAWELGEQEIVTVDALDAAQARERAQRTEGRDAIGEDEMALRWQEQAVITINPGLMIPAERDSAAAMALEVPIGLRRE